MAGVDSYLNFAAGIKNADVNFLSTTLKKIQAFEGNHFAYSITQKLKIFNDNATNFFQTFNLYNKDPLEMQTIVFPYVKEYLNWPHLLLPNEILANNETLKPLERIFKSIIELFYAMYQIGNHIKIMKSPLSILFKLLLVLNYTNNSYCENEDFKTCCKHILFGFFEIINIGRFLKTVEWGEKFSIVLKPATPDDGIVLRVFLHKIECLDKFVQNGKIEDFNEFVGDEINPEILEPICFKAFIDGSFEDFVNQTNNYRKYMELGFVNNINDVILRLKVFNISADFIEKLEKLFNDNEQFHSIKNKLEINFLDNKDIDFSNELSNMFDASYKDRINNIVQLLKYKRELSQQEYKMLNNYANPDFEKKIARAYSVKNVNLVMHEYIFNNEQVYNEAKKGFKYTITAFSKVLDQNFSKYTNDPVLPITIQICNKNTYNLYVMFRNNVCDNVEPDEYATYRPLTRYSRKIKRFGVLINNVAYPENFITGDSSSSISNVDFITNFKRTITNESLINKENFALDTSSTTYISKKLANIKETDLYIFSDETEFSMEFVHDYFKEILGKCLYTINFADVKNKVLIDSGMKYIEIYLDTLNNKRLVNEDWGQYYTSVFMDYEKEIEINKDGNVFTTY